MALQFSTPSSSSYSCSSSSARAIPSSSGFLRKPTSDLRPDLSLSNTTTTFPSFPSSEKMSITHTHQYLRKPLILTLSCSPSSRNRSKASSLNVTETATDFSATSGDWEEEEELGGGGGEGSPWEGAVVYRRDASVTHLEYCTTLERLGLGKLSSDLSRSRASAMGIRLTTTTPTRRGGGSSPPLLGGTPVLISVDVTRKKRKLKLDGIVRTVITLGCNRCAEPAAECLFSNFTLLLTEEPIEEPEEINLGVIFGEDKSRASSNGEGEEDEDERLIDWDDQLHFPPHEKEIDISKHIRDIVHVEITINAVCDIRCKGLCLKCGMNLNKGRCNCSKEGEGEQGGEFGPLENLKRQMERQR